MVRCAVRDCEPGRTARTARAIGQSADRQPLASISRAGGAQSQVMQGGVSQRR